ncbi:MAG: DUF2877 domain-containing protein [Gammaproteobacteria bacterium]|nr:DUF2877 domain-containing protein [Gammaproteobacteria bacterium]
MSELVLQQIGDLALDSLESSPGSAVDSAWLEAGFTRCFYLRWRRSLFCVAAPGMALGPLTLQLSEADYRRAYTHVQRQGCLALARTVRDSLPHSSLTPVATEQSLTLDWTRASRWNSNLPARFRTGAEHYPHAWLQRLQSLAPASMSTSLDVVVRWSDHRSGRLEAATAAYLQRHIGEAERELPLWLTSTTDHPLTGLSGLFGAGAGMTPAGDDVLAGVLLALRLFGFATAADELWRRLRPLGQVRTHAISMALLEAAARGHASEPWHTLLADWSSGDTTKCQRSATLLDAIGQSSGWDTLSGFMLVSATARQLCGSANEPGTLEMTHA